MLKEKSVRQVGSMQLRNYCHVANVHKLDPVSC